MLDMRFEDVTLNFLLIKIKSNYYLLYKIIFLYINKRKIIF